MTYFVLVRGPLGVGKTTVARALAESIGAQVISIDEILERWEWDGGSEELFRKANEVAAETARSHLANGVPVIVDGNFYWQGQIRDLLARLAFPHEVFTLEAPLSICVERDAGRPLAYGAEAAAEVYQKVTRFEWGIPVDATRELSRVVEEIRSRLPERSAGR